MDDRPVVIVTQLDDTTADVVAAALHMRGVPVVRFDLAEFPEQMTLAARVGGAETLHGDVSTLTRSVDLSAVRSLYYRRPSTYGIPSMDEQDHRFALVQARYGFGGVLASLPGCLYVNHPQRVADAEYKPLQLAEAIEVGLTVPETLLTNDPQAAFDFAARIGPVVYKPFRATAYERDGRDLMVWTDEADPNNFDDTIRHTAHMFQTRVDKVADVRVTVIGDQVFPVRIDGDLIDWRYDYDRISYRIVDAPDDVAGAMRAYLRRLGLSFGAFDFGLTEDGEWIFFECNPNGQWAWLEAHTGLPLTDAFAELLAGGLHA